MEGFHRRGVGVAVQADDRAVVVDAGGPAAERARDVDAGEGTASAVAQQEPVGVGVLLQREPEGGEPDDLTAIVDGEREGERGTGDGDGGVAPSLQLEAGGGARVGGIAAGHADDPAAVVEVGEGRPGPARPVDGGEAAPPPHKTVPFPVGPVVVAHDQTLVVAPGSVPRQTARPSAVRRGRHHAVGGAHSGPFTSIRG